MSTIPTWILPEFESDALQAIIHDQIGPESCFLGVPNVRLLDRSFSGVGLFSNFFHVDADGSRIDQATKRPADPLSKWRSKFRHALGLRNPEQVATTGNVLSSDVYLMASGVHEGGLGLLLFIKDDRLSMLEAVSYGDRLWWGSVDHYSLYRASKSNPTERPLEPREVAIILALYDAASAPRPDLNMFNRALVRELSNPPGTIRFSGLENTERYVGPHVATASYQDADGQIAKIALWPDEDGNVLGLDIWKSNLAPLIRYPIPSDLQITAVSVTH